MSPHVPAVVPRIAIYARQSVGEDQGIRQQLDDCRAESRRRGWSVVAEYADNDTSASKSRGTGTNWASMLRAFDDNEFDALLVTDVDRLTRRLADVLEVRPPRRDVRIVTVRGSIDTHDPSGDFMFKQLVLLAEREVSVKSVRSKRYAQDRRQAGHPTSGLTPHGYRWVPSPERDAAGTRYALVDDEAADVRPIFDEFLGGAPLAQIARDLNTAGRRTRSGARWLSTTVRRILMNPTYAALLVPSQPSGKFNLASIAIEECTPGAWEPIVGREFVLAARARLLAAKPIHSGTARKWLLSGLAVCGVCRQPVRSAAGETHPTVRKDSGVAASRRYHAYRCVSGHFHRSGDVIDDFVANSVIARASIYDSNQILRQSDHGPGIDELNAMRVIQEERQATIAQLIADGKLTAQAATQALDNIAQEISEINSQITSLAVRDPLAEIVAFGDAQEWWSKATLARRRTVTEEFMTVVIHPVGHGRRVRTPEQVAATVSIEWKR